MKITVGLSNENMVIKNVKVEYANPLAIMENVLIPKIVLLINTAKVVQALHMMELVLNSKILESNVIMSMNVDVLQPVGSKTQSKHCPKFISSNLFLIVQELRVYARTTSR